MQRQKLFRALFAVIALGMFMTAAVVTAQSIGPPAYDLSWNTIDGGGGTSTGPGFELTGTIGQPDAGGPMTGGAFSLTGGFWPGAGPVPCPGDLNGDGSVNVTDLLALITVWGPCVGCPADLNGNNVVNVTDLLALIANWGLC